MFSKVNDAYQVVKNGLEVEVSLATAEQREQLADAKLALAEMKEQIADLKDENRFLQEKLKHKDDYILEKSVFWNKDDGNFDQPFCPVCYANGSVIPLQKYWEGRDKQQTIWHCPAKKCGATYNPWDHVEDQTYYA